MKNFLILIALLVCNFCDAIQSKQLQKSQIDSFITQSINKHKIPGASLIIVRGDSILYSNGFGFSNIKDNVKMSPSETLVRCGSVSKSFTATAIMILVETGMLNLRAPITDYLTDKELKDFGLMDKKITLHQLLTHSAGFDERLFGSHVKNESEWKTLSEYFKKYPIVFRSEPGQILNYNDQGIAMAGYVVEKVSGMPFYDFVEKKIFSPLKMSNSSFNPILRDDIKKKLSKSYFYDGSFIPYDYDYILPYPAAGLISTVSDMGEFLKAHLAGGRGILSPEFIDEMHSQKFTNHPKLRGWCYGFAEWKENNKRLIFKDGQATGFNSRLMMLPSEKWGFYLVWNRSIFNKGGGINEANKLKSELSSFLIDLYFPASRHKKSEKPLADIKPNDFILEGRYSDMGLGNQNWSKILSLGLQIRVLKENEDNYDISGTKYVRTDKLELQYNSGSNFYAGFTSDNSNKAKYLHFGTGSHERVSFFDNITFQLIILLLFHSSFLVVIVLSFFAVIKRKSKNYLILGLGSTLMFLGLPLLLLGFFTIDFQELYKGATLSMIISSWLPFIGAVLIIFSSRYLIKMKEKKWLLRLSLFNVAFIIYLMYWNFPII
ncbi:serine hydrolase [uncultured Psychroserpens sp.]|uniref:serine hydrolase domain-containing protein n=1 Tax=uncultured Psychroserpens sp. TaxID=255436 RepID=UPI0026240108|nr:serine hydrolase domain-containing protein [uncultured Psychroserpens sp.]